jgi:hypothetical protein
MAHSHQPTRLRLRGQLRPCPRAGPSAFASACRCVPSAVRPPTAARVRGPTVSLRAANSGLRMSVQGRYRELAR